MPLRLCFFAPTMDSKPFGFALSAEEGDHLRRRANIVPVSESGFAHDLLGRALGDDLPPCVPAPGPISSR